MTDPAAAAAHWREHGGRPSAAGPATETGRRSASGSSRLSVLTGAPGAGKTTLRDPLRRLLPGVVVLDQDDFLDPAGRLAGVDLSSPAAAERWPAYTDLCLGLVAVLLAAGTDVLLLSPLEPAEVDRSAAAPSPGEVRWAVLDCADATRRQRLAARPLPPDPDTFADAARLRTLGLPVIPGDAAGVDETARTVAAWAVRSG